MFMFSVKMLYGSVVPVAKIFVVHSDLAVPDAVGILFH